MIRQFQPLPGNPPRYERWKKGERLEDVLESDRLEGGCYRSQSGNGFWSTYFCNQPTVDGMVCAEHVNA